LEAAARALEFGINWREMLSKLAEAESVVDIYLCQGAFGNQEDRQAMNAETHGVRIIFVGEDYFIVGPRRPVGTAIIKVGWLAMIRIHPENEPIEPVGFIPDEIKLETPKKRAQKRKKSESGKNKTAS
jgi:hypothetical protein